MLSFIFPFPFDFADLTELTSTHLGESGPLTTMPGRSGCLVRVPASWGKL